MPRTLCAEDWIFIVPFVVVLALVPTAIVAAVIGRRGARPSRAMRVVAQVCLGLTILLPLPALALVLFVAGAWGMGQVVLIAILVTVAVAAIPAVLSLRAIRHHSSDRQENA